MDANANINITSVGVLSALLGAAVAWGAMQTTVSNLRRDVDSLKTADLTHSTAIADVKVDLAAIKTDTNWVKETLSEIKRFVGELHTSLLKKSGE